MVHSRVTGQDSQGRILTLEANQNLESKLFRLKKGWVLQFRRGASLFGKNVDLLTNYPLDSKPFDRLHYRALEWKSDSGSKTDDTSFFVNLDIQLAGAFHFKYNVHEEETEGGCGYLVVDPSLALGGEALSMDAIKCQTVLAKNMGPISEWRNRLAVAPNTGYNMIHFTPIQELGGSNSAYSLSDQLALNPTFNDAGKKCTFSDIETLTKEMEERWNVLSITDIVLNHTANESAWLQKHPDATYNLLNCPHLRPAYLLDRALQYTSHSVASGKWEEKGVPVRLVQDHQLQALRGVLQGEVLPPLRLHEFYQCHVDDTVQAFREHLETTKLEDEGTAASLSIKQDPQYRRLKSSVDMGVAVHHFGPHRFGGDVTACCKALGAKLHALNDAKYREIQGHLGAAVNGTIGTIRYERLENDGPRIAKVTEKSPLVPPYFTQHGPENSSMEADETLSFSPNACFLMAHNGWVMQWDPLKNFAAEGVHVYLRRELVAWGDSVKLRYGDCPSDSPFLWAHMRQYCEYTAKYFHGIRLDNCHSTPMHVAEYLLDCARRVRPDLYVIAELFTSSEETDNQFVNRLGINSLIREGMSAPNSHELGRLVYRYGGAPVGAFLQPPMRPLAPCVAHAMFLDLTHDNKSPVETRTPLDLVPSSALVNMACCATGSNRGYDELVPHHIHVVNESRLYQSWGDGVSEETGIIAAKAVLNELHQQMAEEGFTEVFVDQVTADVVTVTRHNPHTHDSVVLVAFTAFSPVPETRTLRPLEVQGQLIEIVAEIEQSYVTPGVCLSAFRPSPSLINGLEGVAVSVQRLPQLSEARLVRLARQTKEGIEIAFTEHFKPGCVVAFRFGLMDKTKAAAAKYQAFMGQIVRTPGKADVVTALPKSAFAEATSKLTLVGLNHALYRCEEEEKDATNGEGGVYHIPGWKALPYAGLQGLESLLSHVRSSNDLGHPLCSNLREGDWLPEYTASRLLSNANTKPLGLWMQSVVSELKQMPRYLQPAYFDGLINMVYLALINTAWQLMSGFIREGSVFTRALGSCSVQFCSVINSAPLPALSPKLAPPTTDTPTSIAAGLPHFCCGYLRNWGRDQFISLPGNLLIPGRYQEARWILLSFAGNLRHGLIPNLLDGGANARYNCRDAVWFWLYAIQRYVEMVPEGSAILNDTVTRMFPTDDSPVLPPGEKEQPLHRVIYEAMSRHFKGERFRERNAGHKIDDQMTDEGFNNEIGVTEKGFPFGGHAKNCGTWMDKMGSSERACNKGQPATPRDGSAVEIVGLCYAALQFLNTMQKLDRFPYTGVTKVDNTGNRVEWSWSFWAGQIKANFSAQFYIGEERAKDPIPMLINRDKSNADKPVRVINRTRIYKDTVGATDTYPDYQLRCNFPIALAVAPDLVDPAEGLGALDTAERCLLGPLGVKTLDPSDWNYRPDYHNSDDSADHFVARGFNYHQGPEWVWPVGFLLRAKLLLAAKLGDKAKLTAACASVRGQLSHHFSELRNSDWRSLPELTNGSGAICHDSNPAQSWSTGCILEVLYDLHKISKTL